MMANIEDLALISYIRLNREERRKEKGTITCNHCRGVVKISELLWRFGIKQVTEESKPPVCPNCKNKVLYEIMVSR